MPQDSPCKDPKQGIPAVLRNLRFLERYSGQLPCMASNMPLVQAAVDPGTSLKVESLEQTLNKKPPPKLETCPFCYFGFRIAGVLGKLRFGAT